MNLSLLAVAAQTTRPFGIVPTLLVILAVYALLFALTVLVGHLRRSRRSRRR